MSLNPRYVTQGGQVLLMRLKMFIQVNNAIGFYLFLFWVISGIGILLMRLSIENMMNGIIYWYVRAGNGFFRHMAQKPTLHINYKGLRLNYSPDQVLNDVYTVWCGQTLKQELFIAFSVSMVLVFFVMAGVYWFMGNEGRKQSEDEIIGGRELSEDPKTVTRMMKRRGEASDIRIDDLSLKKNAEIQNFAMHGTVGAGKSQLMNKKLRQLRERGDLVIIYDKGCQFIEHFYDESRDKVLNALDERCPNWDLWEECQSLTDLENVSTTLIPASSGEDPFWQGSARTIFAEGAERMRDAEDRSYNSFLRTLLAIKLDQLRKFLEGTPASVLVDGKIEKTAISIRSVLTNYVKALRYLQGIDKKGKPKFTIKDWMKGQANKSQNGWLFITSSEEYHESLKPLISMWLSIAATSLLSMGENRQRRVWFFYDELPSLHKLPQLPRIIAEARKFGGCFVLGFQSFAQVEETYGPKAAEGMFDLLNTKFFFRSPSATVAQFVEKDIGETRRKKFNEQTSFGAEQVRDGISYGKDEERVSIISYSDIQSLDDLQCYVTLPGRYPVVKLSMKYHPMAKVAEGLLLRDLQTSLDPTIDADLDVRSAEDKKSLDDLFNPEAEATTPAPAAVDSTPGEEPVGQPEQDTATATAEKPAAAGPVTESAVNAEQGGGTEQEMERTLPPGINDEGEVVDIAAYEHWTATTHTRDEVRREEVNINDPVRHERDFEHEEIL